MDVPVPVAGASPASGPTTLPTTEDAATRAAPAASAATTAPAPSEAAANSLACNCRCDAVRWLQVCLGCQMLIAVMRLLCPRPLLAAGNVFLVFMGWGKGGSASLVRLFFLAFFSLILGISDAFWLIVKCTGPYGMAWMDPKFYWKPFLGGPHGLPVPTPDGIPVHAMAHAADATRGGVFPPERPPARFQIYLELISFCISPLVW